jgi:hypothetical protein
LSINVTTSNQGELTETFNVILYANATEIGMLTNITLASGNFTTLTFTWNTTGFVNGEYTISAYAVPFPGETDTIDNSVTGGIIKVATPGDVNTDGVVNVLDAAAISAHWYQGPPIGPLGYDPNFDINGDGEIGILDAAIVSAYWTGQPAP